MMNRLLSVIFVVVAGGDIKRKGRGGREERGERGRKGFQISREVTSYF